MKRENAVRLTKTLIDKAKPKERTYFLWDIDQPGLGLRVTSTGFKAFYVQYRIGGGRGATAQKLKLGNLNEIGIDEARRAAAIKRGLAAEGKDPAKERKADRRSSTVKDLIDLYEISGCHCRGGKRSGQAFGDKTKRYTMARLRNHVLPLLGKKRLSNLSKKDILDLFNGVTNGETATRDEEASLVGRKVGAPSKAPVLGRLGIAKKVVRDFSSVCSFAVEQDLMPSNPVKSAGISTIDEQRKSYLTDEQITRLGKALDEAEHVHGVNPMAVDQIRLWLLTGLRRDEGASLPWDGVDFEKKQIVLPKSKSTSERPLTPAAIKLLNRLLQKAPKDENGVVLSPLVFPSKRGEGHYTGMKRFLPLIKRLAGLKELYPHLLRHTVGSTAVSSGLSLHLTGAILGHKNPRSTLVYAHVQDKAALDAASSFSSKIEAALAIPE